MQCAEQASQVPLVWFSTNLVGQPVQTRSWSLFVVSLATLSRQCVQSGFTTEHDVQVFSWSFGFGVKLAWHHMHLLLATSWFRQFEIVIGLHPAKSFTFIKPSLQ